MNNFAKMGREITYEYLYDQSRFKGRQSHYHSFACAIANLVEEEFHLEHDAGTKRT